MHRAPSVLQVLASAKKADYRDTVLWLVWSMMGGLAPLYLSFGWFAIHGAGVSVHSLAKHGEFALYSAAMLAPTLHLVTRDFRTALFPGRGWIVPVCVFALMVSVLVFGALVDLQAFADQGQVGAATHGEWMGVKASYALFVVGAFLSTLVYLLSVAFEPPDMEQIAKGRLEKLGADFDRSGGANAQ